MYVLTVNQDNLGKGTEVEVPGLGLFKNGEPAELTPEQVETYRLTRGDFDDEGHWSRAGTPLQETKHAYGVNVEFRKDGV